MADLHKYPPGQWGMLVKQWRRALKSDNKSDRTITTYLYAVRILGEWASNQPEPIEPTSIGPRHIREFIGELIDKTSAANAHMNYRRCCAATAPARPTSGPTSRTGTWRWVTGCSR